MYDNILYNSCKFKNIIYLCSINSPKQQAMQKNFEILDAGLVCEDGTPVRFEIEYEALGSTQGTISAGLELCFDALNNDDNEKWVRYACGTCELREQSWHLQPEANAGRTMPLGEWVAERVFQEGYSGAAEKIISYISKL